MRGAEECQDARLLFDGDIARDFEPQDQDARVAEEVAGLEGPRRVWHEARRPRGPGIAVAVVPHASKCR